MEVGISTSQGQSQGPGTNVLAVQNRQGLLCTARAEGLLQKSEGDIGCLGGLETNLGIGMEEKGSAGTLWGSRKLDQVAEGKGRILFAAGQDLPMSGGRWGSQSSHVQERPVGLQDQLWCLP
jgi:hypothetical protein